MAAADAAADAVVVPAAAVEAGVGVVRVWEGREGGAGLPL